MKRFFCALIFFQLFIVSSLASPPPILLSTDTEGQSVQPSSFMIDETGSLSLSEVIKLQENGKFEPYTSNRSPKIKENETYWIWFELSNPTNGKQSWILDFSNWAYLDMYIPGIEQSPKKAGFRVPFSKKDYPVFRRMGLFHVELEAGQTLGCYVKLKHFLRIVPYPGNLDFQFFTKEEIDQENSLLSVYMFSILGMLLIMGIYNLFIYLSTGDRNYLVYLSLPIIGIYWLIDESGLLKQIFDFYPDSMYVLEVARMIMMAGSVAVVLVFILYFLDVRQRWPKWHKFCIGLLFAFMVAVNTIYIYFPLGFFMVTALDGLASIIILILIIKSIRSGNKASIYLLAGHCAIFIGANLILLTMNQLIPQNMYTSFLALPVANVFEILFFSFALSNKIKLLQRENFQNQQQILGQLKENQALQIKVNQELEQKVVERTEELIAQQKLIKAAQLALEREKSEKAIQKAMLEKEQAVASENMKKQFFSQITHEFRTPLTLILGPLQEIVQQTQVTKIRRHGEFALRNSKILLRLINQLLGLSKLEEGREETRLENLDLVEFVRERVTAFHLIGQKKDIALSIVQDAAVLSTHFDPDMMEKILNNLLSNAVKFTLKGGKIQVRVGEHPNSKNHFRVSVKDNGIGIPEEKLPYIFNQFYQVEGEKSSEFEGTGLGLPLARNLVELHGGELKVSSLEGLGTEMTVIIPKEQEGKIWASNQDRIQSAGWEQEAIPFSNNSLEDWELEEDHDNLVLVIEDNGDIREYIKMALEPVYNVMEAVNGTEGIQKALQHVPNLVISDVMMPGANGFEVCKTLKTEDKTSHIPLILLTAKTAIDSKIKGLETGADAYLSKPFNHQELLVRIKKLIEGRENLKEYYRKEMITTPIVSKAISREEQFLLRLKQVILVHLSNESYSVEELAGEMAMSRSQLHRKLKALSGQSAGEFMRNYRLEYAYQLLEQDTSPVGEIAFQVGFSSASYFSRAFSIRYGKSPKAVRKRE